MATERLNFREKKKTFKNLLLRSHVAFIAVHSGKRCGRWASGLILSLKSCCIFLFLKPHVIGRPCGSVAPWSECLHGMREILCLSPRRAMCFFLSRIRWPVWGCALAANSEGTVSLVPVRFRGLVAQQSECSHSMWEVLGSILQSCWLTYRTR